MSPPIRSTIRQIRRYSQRFSRLSEDQLRQESLALKYQAMSGTPVTNLIPRGFGLVADAARRCLGFTHYDVQFLCGIHLVEGRIAEMKTGEGKTLTASLPVFLHALTGRGVHVATVNDYLAERDHDELKPVYQMLGLTCGVVTGNHAPEARARAYRQDITYGSAKEFGFDFLRDRLKRLQQSAGGAAPDEDLLVQRQLNFVLVDEADSILIDEARTPLIIGMIDREEEQIKQDCYTWAAAAAPEFDEDIDFTYDHMRRKVELTLAGRSRLRLLKQNDGSRQVSIRELYEFMENAIKVRRDYQLDRNYAVIEEKVVIIDEFTGRPAEGRQWQGGIHQSVEAREQIPITPATRQAAMITVQNYFKKYRLMSGMTGTAWTSRREFSKVYKKRVLRIPTHRPTMRTALPVRVFKSFETKMAAVAVEIRELLDAGRSVLIGTRSVEKSERLSQILNEADIAHRVLNAKNLEREADIVAAAGEPGSVTVATNMAGRGTDIKLNPSVCNAGGLHVILTEIHESQRIDWQLIGRGARQGDPGSFRIFVALDDEILDVGLGPGRAARLRRKTAGRTTSEWGELHRSLFLAFRRAQRTVQRKHLVDRMILLKQDRERQEKLFETGQDPYLDVVE